jgi:UDP-N-acetylglucosamine transferase subunit ALG13
MVLVTIGTNEQPFDRLVAAAAALDIDDELVVQYGSASITAGPGTWIDYLGFDELAERMRAARVVVCHAGVGSIMLARQCHRTPVVVPRRLHFGEAVDDHQLPLSRRLAASGLVRLVEDVTGLARAIATHTDGPAPAGHGGLPGVAALVRELRSGLDRAGVAARGAV